MPNAINEAMVELIVARVSETVITQIGKRLEDHEARLDELTATARLSTAAVTGMLERLTTDPPGGDGPPAAITAACTGHPDTGPQRVTVDVAGRTVTEYVHPGSDPAQVWADMRAAVTTAQPQEAGAWRN